MKTTALLIITCLALALSVAQGVRVKIQLEKESVERYQHHVYKRQSGLSACTDAMAVDRNSLTLPGQLDNLNQRVTFYRSEIARINFDTFQDTTKVPLANFSTTYLREVLNVLKDNGCPPFFFGGAVRDQFLGATPKDADVEIDCTIERFFSICSSTWGAVNCGMSSSRPLGHVGLQDTSLENVDVASTDITFYAPIFQLEYTANSMAYDLNGNNVLIDLTGTGQLDVCNSPSRHIRIPSDDDSIETWEQWVGPSGSNGSVLLRFWKLRSRDFDPFNDATLDFIVDRSKQFLAASPHKFGEFYCKNVYEGSEYRDNKYCDTTTEVCTNAMNMEVAASYKNVFAQDFGLYWNEKIVPDLLPICGPDNSMTTIPTPDGSGALQFGYHAIIMAVVVFFAFLL